MVNQKNTDGITNKVNDSMAFSDNPTYKPGTLDEILRELLRPIVREILALEAEATADEDSEEDYEKPKDVRYYTREEVCEKLKICRATFHNWINTGKLSERKIGGRVYIDADSLDRALAENKVRKFTNFRIKPLKK